jgi:hypothetical protein
MEPVREETPRAPPASPPAAPEPEASPDGEAPSPEGPPFADDLARFEAFWPKYRLDALTEEERLSYWYRLPEEFRERILEARQREMIEEQRTSIDLWKHRWLYGIVGAVMALLCGLIQGSWAWPYLILFVLVQGAAALAIVYERLGSIRGVMVYGATGLMLQFVGLFVGGVRWHGVNPGALVLFFFGWVFLLSTGALLAELAEIAYRHRHSAY